MRAKQTKKTKEAKKSKKLYVCGRCGYRSHHRMACPSCGFHLEEECGKCYSAKGNCVCRFHGAFVGGRKMSNGGKSSATAMVKKKRRKKPKK